MDLSIDPIHRLKHRNHNSWTRNLWLFFRFAAWVLLMQHTHGRGQAVGGAAGAGDALHGGVVGVLRLGFRIEGSVTVLEGSQVGPIGIYK